MPSIFKSSSKKAKGRPELVIGEPQGVKGGPGYISKYVETGIGEFGAMPAGAAHESQTLRASPQSPSVPTRPPLLPPKYSFSPTYIPHKTSSDNSIDSTQYSDLDLLGLRPYGFLGGIGSGIVLGLEDVRKVVVDVARELEGRGLMTPLLFSNQALEGSQGRTKLLIQAYIDMMSSNDRHPLPASSSSHRSYSFATDLQYAKEYELAWFLRWAMARITRKKEGTAETCHGIIEWDVYEEWRGRERAANYPADAFSYLSALIPSPAYMLLQPLFHLLSRLAAHSHLSGLTPHALSSLFAPILFNIPVSAPALVSHTTFVRAAAATEHLLLAYIRSTSRNTDLGLNDLPGRLKEWVTGYPSMVISDNDLVKGLPRRGSRVVRCERATRVVRSYSKDLISTVETWSEKDQWPAWERVVLRSKRGEDSRPKYTSAYRRRLVIKETPPLPASLLAESSQPTQYGIAQLGNRTTRKEEGRRDSDEEGKWGSLAGKEWSMFEEGGFALEGNDFGDKLRFDLTESAKMSVTERRKTMDWTDFASPSGGFTRTDPALTTTLTFSAPLKTSIEQWPKERSDLQRRLHKSHKDSVPFNHDTSPRFGDVSGWDGEGEVRDSKGRVYIEEAFVDFWADIALGCGWVDRSELTFRESSWVIVELRARPSSQGDTRSSEDPRTTALYFLFEEKVPREYQHAIANPQEKRSFALFHTKKKKPTTQPDRIPLGTSEGEFDRMLLNRSTTKKVSLSGKRGQEASIWHKQVDIAKTPPASPIKFRMPKEAKLEGFVVKSRAQTLNPPAEIRPLPATHKQSRDGMKTFEGKPLFFGKSVNGRKERTVGARAEAIDFELQSASGVGSPSSSPEGGGRDDEKWLDILVSNGARRMDRQDARAPPSRRSPPSEPLSPPRDQRKSRTPSPRTAGPLPSPERLPDSNIYHSPDSSGEPDEEVQTPRPSGFLQHAPSHIYLEPAIETASPTDPSLPPALPAKPLVPRKPLPVPHQTHHVHYVENEADRNSWSSSSFDRAGMLAPSPRYGRDTIHNIVDTYRDSDISTRSDYDDTGRYSRFSSEGQQGEVDEMYASEDGEHERYSSDREDRERLSSNTEDGMEELASPASVGEGDKLEPPKPIFDITPTREPSPGRYRHGEALHFVQEEAEEDR